MGQPRQLRLAVAMRGGVSLAVYMGGVCSELARLRASAGAPSADGAYSPWLRAADVEAVEVDVLAGTSAGGLNGVLLAAHLVYGMPFGDNVRDMWLQLGDLERLCRNPRNLAVESVLDGDNYFYTALRDTLEALTPRPGAIAETSALRLILTATRVDPRRDAVRPVLGPTLPTGASRAHFRFRHAADQEARWPGDALSDFGTTDQGFVDTLRCLAYAGRTTSSFPGAFEPARPIVARSDARGRPFPPIPPRDVRIDMTGVCSEAGAPEPGLQGRVELIDGGVLDNIPIAWAIRAIASSPATEPIDRWLLYLQPVPPKTEPRDTDVGTPRRRRLSRLLGVLIKSLSIKTASDSLLDDEVELHDAMAHGEQARDADATVNALCHDRPPEALITDASLDQYVRSANSSEAQRFPFVVEHPTGALGGDPLPLPAGVTALAPLDAVGKAAQFLTTCAEVPSMGFTETPRRLDDVARLGLSAVPIVRSAMSLLSWICILERDGEESVSPQVRDDLYATRLVGETLVAVRDRMLLATCAARLRDAETAGDVTTVRPADVVRDVDALLARRVADAGLATADGSATEWRAFAQRIASTIVEPPPGEPPAPGAIAPSSNDGRRSPNPALPVLWSRLAILATRLAGHDVSANDRTALRHVLTADLDIETAVRRLVAYEVLVGPLRPDPLAESTPIRFAAITAANASPLESLIFGSAPLTSGERVDRKLSGNQIGNFAAFLSARWRHADWIWGRLDAVQSIAAILAARLPFSIGAKSLRDACFAGASYVVEPVLRSVWDMLEIDDTNVRDRAALAITARLQLDILATELPLLLVLDARPNGSDLPPDLTELRVQPFREAADLENAAPTLDKIGVENIWDLASRTDLRRTIVRVGLVTWEAVEPADGVTARVVQAVLLALKPFAVASLVAWIAPWSGLVAAAAAYLVAAITAHTWFSFTAYFFASGGALLVVTGGAQRALGRQRARRRRAPPPGASKSTTPSGVKFWTIIAATVAALVLGGVLLHAHTGAPHWGTARAVATVAVLELFGAGLPLAWLAGRVGSVGFGEKTARVLLAVAAATAATAVVCAAVYPNRVPSWLAALLGVWAPLAAVTAVLMLAYPPASRPPLP